MYTKLFRSIFDGSLYGQFEALTVFMSMLALADHKGVVDVVPGKLAASLGCDLAFVTKGIEQLMAPDKYSRTPDNDGRRLVPLLNEDGEPRPFGWQIVNYAKYRAIRNEDDRRTYKRDWDRSNRSISSHYGSGGVNTNQGLSGESDTFPTRSDPSPTSPTYTEAEAEAITPTPFAELVALYHQHMPNNPKVKAMSDSRKKHIQARWMDSGLLDCQPFDKFAKGPEPRTKGLEAWGLFFKVCGRSKFLTNQVPRSEGHETFRVDLDWIMNPTNFVKILEDKYSGVRK